MQVIGSMHIGGAENVVVNLARGLDRSRFDIGVCCTRELGVLADRLMAEGVEVRLVRPRRARFRHFTTLTLARELARWRADVVHTHGVVAMIHAGPLGMARLLPRWIHTFHFGNYDGGLTREMRAERVLCRAASELIAVSDTQRQSLMRNYRVRPDRISTIVNGVSDNRFAGNEESRRRKREELGLRPDDIVVGCVAVLSEQKGITYLLQAAQRILAADPRVRLLIVGGGPLEAALRREAAASHAGDRIVFTGWRNDTLEILPAFDVFVMSSLWEAMPMVLLEAMAASRPIVVTDVGENAAITDGGRCGRVVPPRDPAAIAAAVVNLVERPDEAELMGARAYERYSGRFTTARMVADYEDLFGRVADSRRTLSAARSPL